MGNLCSNPNEPERGGFSTWPLEQNAYSAPKWTPSGNMIVFQHKDAIYTVNRQGTKLKRITSGDENDYELHQAPEISPDGSRIVYSTTRHKVSRNSQWVRNFDIEAMDIDGSNRVRLTNSRYWDLRPTWSQDGQRVFFRRVSRNDDAVVGTFAVNADGTDEQHLTWMHHGLRQSHHNDRTALWVESDSKLIHAKTGIWPVEYEIKKETTFVEEGESFIATANLDLSDLAEHRRFPDVSFPNPDHPPFQRMAMEIPGSIAWSPDGEKLAYILTRYDREDVEALKKYRIQEGPEPETVRTLNILNLADSKETSMELTDPACRGLDGLVSQRGADPDVLKCRLHSGPAGRYSQSIDNTVRTKLACPVAQLRSAESSLFPGRHAGRHTDQMYRRGRHRPHPSLHIRTRERRHLDVHDSPRWNRVHPNSQGGPGQRQAEARAELRRSPKASQKSD